MFRWFRRKVVPPSPKDVLVDMICLRILSAPKEIDDMLVRNYYDSFSWEHKNFHIQFNTCTYSSRSPANVITKLEYRNAGGDWVGIPLEERHKTLLLAALNKADLHARSIVDNEAKAAEEMKACDALVALLELPENTS